MEGQTRGGAAIGDCGDPLSLGRWLFFDEDYYVPEFKLTSAPTLRRGANLIGKDGTVRRARFERKLPGLTNAGPWSWFDNPFVGTREFNGLRTMMAILTTGI